MDTKLTRYKVVEIWNKNGLILPDDFVIDAEYQLVSTNLSRDLKKDKMEK